MRNRLVSMTLVSAAVCMLAPPIHAAPRPKPGYDSFIVGNPADASPPPGMTSGLVLMGGGLDVDEAYQWMCQRAGGGDFVVIRTTGTDAYNPYIQQLCPQMDSVETIIITTVAGATRSTTRKPSGSREGISRPTSICGVGRLSRPKSTTCSIPRGCRWAAPARDWRC